MLAAASCYRPAPGVPCTITCDDGVCPASFECGADGLCYAHGGNECTAAVPDAAVDSAEDAVPDASAMPLLLQQTFAGKHGTTTELATFATAPTSGNVLVMVGANNSGPLVNVTGGGVTTWRRADASSLCANTEIWYGVTTGGSATVTLTGFAMGDAYVWVGEWSGLDTSNLLDKHAAAGTNSDPSTTPAPGSITTTSPRELVILGVASFTGSLGTPTPGSWTSALTTGANGFVQGEWYLVTSASNTFAPSVGPSTNCWDAAIASFRVP
jgi:hypothetical protein